MLDGTHPPAFESSRSGALPARAYRLRFCLPGKRSRTPARGDRDGVVNVVDNRNRPRDFADIVLQPFVWHRSRQRHASAFTANLDFARPLNKFERVVDQFLDIWIRSRTL